MSLVSHQASLYTKCAYCSTGHQWRSKVKAILQDIQFHPVSDKILHVDFYQLSEDKEVSMEIPVVVEEGSAPGVLLEGGTLIISKRKLKVRALPKNLPDVITVNVSSLNLGDKISTADLDSEDFTILHPDISVVGKVRTSRASRSLEEGRRTRRRRRNF